MDVQKGRGRPKIQFSYKVAKFAEYIGIDLTLIFCINNFLHYKHYTAYSVSVSAMDLYLIKDLKRLSTQIK